MQPLIQDLRYGLRMLRKNPGFTAVAVLTLAIGIAVNTIVFTAYDVVALKAPTVADPSRVVNFNYWRQDGHHRLFSYPEYAYFRDHNSVFTGLIAQSFVDGLIGAMSDSSSMATTNGGAVPRGYRSRARHSIGCVVES
jgi:hypothetical protein